MEEVEAAEHELEKRHATLSKMALREMRLVFRPPDSGILYAENADPSAWTAWLVGNWSDWLEAHEAVWSPAGGVFECNISIPVGTNEFKWVVNDLWGEIL